MMFGMSLFDLHHTVFQKILCGLSLNEIEREVPFFLKEFLETSLYLPATRALEAAKEEGHFTAILSNSPNFLVAPIAEFFRVDDWQATEYGVDKDGRLCKIANLMEATNKASFVVEMAKRLGIGKDAITVYTDSYHDLPLLLEAGSVVAVNPDRKLRRLATQHRWSVI
jgi:phosphoserine phosphatase